MMLIEFGWTEICVGLLLLALTLIVLWKRNKSPSYLLFFAIFWIYLMGVVSVVAFPFPAPGSYVLTHFKPNINLMPFRFGSCEFEDLCIRGIYQNILLTIPFGFGINFVARIKSRYILWLALLVGLVCESIQLVISLVVRSPFRVVDINDVLLNSLGVVIGFGIFKLFARLYLYVVSRFALKPKNIFLYIDEIIRTSQ